VAFVLPLQTPSFMIASAARALSMWGFNQMQMQSAMNEIPFEAFRHQRNISSFSRSTIIRKEKIAGGC